MLSQTQILNCAKIHKIPMEYICQIADICDDFGVPVKGTMFKRLPEDVKKLLQICQDNGIDVSKCASIFNRLPEDAQDIIDICHEENMVLEAQLFDRHPDRIKESIKYVKENFGPSYVYSRVVMRDVENLKASIPTVKSLGILSYAIHDPSIFDLTRDEILERAGVLYYLMLPLHDETEKSKRDRLNKIFGLSKEKFEDYCQENKAFDNVRKDYTEIIRQRVEAVERNREKKNIK